MTPVTAGAHHRGRVLSACAATPQLLTIYICNVQKGTHNPKPMTYKSAIMYPSSVSRNHRPGILVHDESPSTRDPMMVAVGAANTPKWLSAYQQTKNNCSKDTYRSAAIPRR